MLVNRLKNGLLYAVMGPLIGSFVVFVIVAALFLSNEVNDLTVYDYGAIFLVIAGGGYVVGIIPALATGLSQSIAKHGGAQSRSHIFVKVFIITSLVLTGLLYKYVLVKPQLLIAIVFFAVIGGIASIIIERGRITRISSEPK